MFLLQMKKYFFIMIARSLKQIRPYLSLRRFDVSTDDGRASERQRRALLSTLVAMAAKLISVATQLLTVPLTLNYLGTDRFGMWMTMSSVIVMLAFADLGIGNGLINAISEANGKDNIAAIKQLISSAVVVLTLIAVAIFITFIIVYPHIPWPEFFNVHSQLAATESGPAVLAFVICFALNIPATIVQRVQLGLQMGFIANLWQAAGSLMAFAAILCVIHLKAGLWWLVLAFAGTPLISSVCNGVIFFNRTQPELLPSWARANRKDALKLMRLGLRFLVLQIAVAMAFLSDNLIISRLLGANAVGSYAVPDKMFSIISLVVSMMMAPLWPAYGEAISRGDGAWVRRILRKSLIISLGLSVLLSSILLVCAPKLLSVWLGHLVEPPFILLLGMALFRVFDSVGSGLAAFLNGANVIKIQLTISCLMAISAISLKFLLIPLIGVSGAVWATVISYFIFEIIPYSVALPKLVARSLQKQPVNGELACSRI